MLYVVLLNATMLSVTVPIRHHPTPHPHTKEDFWVLYYKTFYVRTNIDCCNLLKQASLFDAVTSALTRMKVIKTSALDTVKLLL
jgi:hypothetical protein